MNTFFDSYKDGPSDMVGSIERALTSYTPRYQRFLVKARSYSQQYSHIYTKRIMQMREIVLDAARHKWGDADKATWQECKKVIDLRPGGDREWLVVGCIYKDQPLKPSILDEYSGERGLEPPVPRANYTSDADSAVLEDESGRVVLAAGRWHPVNHGGFHKRKNAHGSNGPEEDGCYAVPLSRIIDTLATGVVVAIRGTILESGELAVNDICVPGLYLPSPAVGIPRVPRTPDDPPVYALLVSNVRVGNFVADSQNEHPLALQLLLDFIKGLAGNSREVAKVARIARVVVAGNLIGRSTLKPITAAGQSFARGNSLPSLLDRSVTLGEQDAIADPMKDADVFLSQICATVPVDVMPGEGDPSNFTLPQQPLHPVLFPLSSKYSTLRCVTNPYDAEIGGVRFLGTSGQAVADIARYTRTSTPMTPGDEMGLRTHHMNALGAEESDDDMEQASSRALPTAAAPSSASRGHVTRSAMHEGADDEQAPSDVVEAVSSTILDKSLTAIAGTGAGAGYEFRAANTGDNGVTLLNSLSELDILCNTLYWRHVAPTCPDTLASYPFYDYDPYAIDNATLPNILFSGGSKSFGTRLVADTTGTTKVRIVTIPDFSVTHTAVLVNLSTATFECQPIAVMPQF